MGWGGDWNEVGVSVVGTGMRCGCECGVVWWRLE